MSERQIVSKERVRAHGEVYTAAREVNAMLDLVKDETRRIDSRFLEPACGDGNFLAEILRRKLAACSAYAKSPLIWERYSVLAISSIYGVELLADNVAACRERLFEIWQTARQNVVGSDGTSPRNPTEAVRFILSRNVLCGDALSLKQADGNPIVFSEWALVGERMNRRDFRLDVLLEKGEAGTRCQGTLSLPGFVDANSDINWMVDPDDAKRMIPAPVRTFAPIEYWRVHETD